MSELAEKLKAARAEYLARGGKFLDWEEIHAEIGGYEGLLADARRYRWLMTSATEHDWREVAYRMTKEAVDAYIDSEMTAASTVAATEP